MQAIAETILIQLGGRKFIAITGSKNFLALPDALRFSLSRNLSGANRCKITLCANDTYEVLFYRQSLNKKSFAVTLKDVAQFDDVYWDQLQEIFTSVTGLLTSL